MADLPVERETKREGVYKLYRTKDILTHSTVVPEALKGFFPLDADDTKTAYIHACDHEHLQRVREKFFVGENVLAAKLDVEEMARAGFVVKYEANKPGGTKYWHFYPAADKPEATAKLVPNHAVVQMHVLHCI